MSQRGRCRGKRGGSWKVSSEPPSLEVSVEVQPNPHGKATEGPAVGSWNEWLQRLLCMLNDQKCHARSCTLGTDSL